MASEKITLVREKTRIIIKIGNSRAIHVIVVHNFLFSLDGSFFYYETLIRVEIDE